MLIAASPVPLSFPGGRDLVGILPELVLGGAFLLLMLLDLVIPASKRTWLAGFALLILFSFAMLWVGMLLGLLARTPDAVNGVAFILVFPLTFIANTFVPAGSLPDGLRQAAEYNPVSALSAAVRTLFGNPTALPSNAAWPLQHPVLSGLAWCLLLLLVVVPLTIRRYRVRTVG